MAFGICSYMYYPEWLAFISFKYIWAEKHLALAQGPSGDSLAVLWLELVTFWAVGHHLNHWATTALFTPFTLLNYSCFLRYLIEGIGKIIKHAIFWVLACTLYFSNKLKCTWMHTATVSCLMCLIYCWLLLNGHYNQLFYNLLQRLLGQQNQQGDLLSWTAWETAWPPGE